MHLNRDVINTQLQCFNARHKKCADQESLCETNLEQRSNEGAETRFSRGECEVKNEDDRSKEACGLVQNRETCWQLCSTGSRTKPLLAVQHKGRPDRAVNNINMDELNLASFNMKHK